MTLIFLSTTGAIAFHVRRKGERSPIALETIIPWLKKKSSE
ncbi:hypothetical protein [Okeania sp. SIO2C2]|nr:hypothetical protein [Okeania sp. SIO2C2]